VDLMTIRFKLSRRRAVIVLLALAAFLATAAVAAWTVSSSGNAYSKAGTASPVTLSDASGSTTGDLYPGGTGSVKLRVANPNPFAVRITAVSLTSGGTITSDSSACNSGGTGVTFSNQSGLALDLAANASATTFTLAGAASMSNGSDNSCQGAVFTIPVDVTAASH
jgi:hypothetical protein